MLRLGLIILTISICFLTAFPQNETAPLCPMISVSGPPGIVNVKELALYTVTVEREADYQLEFVWTTTAGRIKDGQGTRSINVIMPDDTFTVTVDVKGLPASCPSTASEFLSCRLLAPLPEKIYELQPAQAVTRAGAGTGRSRDARKS